MKKNVIAILNHSVKGKDFVKQHRFCPPGESSWCKWQQDQASGTATYKNDGCLPEMFLELLRPTFMTLSETELLERCFRGKTQNRNECINLLVWVRCPKHKHHGVKAIGCAAASAVLHFHGGAAREDKVMERLSIRAEKFTSRALLARDRKRLQKSDLRPSRKQKKRRQSEQLRRTRREEALQVEVYKRARKNCHLNCHLTILYLKYLEHSHHAATSKSERSI